MSFNIEVEGGSSVRLPTAGKYCDRDIVITATGGGGENKLMGVIDGTVTELTAQDLTGITKFRNRAFRECTKLTRITIPNTVTSIGEEAFLACRALIGVEIPNSVTYIADGAFYNCSKLPSINIPYGIKTIGYVMFYGCTNLASVTLPDTLTTIGRNAFEKCSSLVSIYIPFSVTTIDQTSFYNCSSLKRVDLSNHNKIPTLNRNVFGYTHANLQIKVPASLIDDWKAATNWSAYAEKIVTEFTNEV